MLLCLLTPTQATGTIGKFIVAELLKTGKHEVTAITRSDSKSVVPDGIKVAKINYDDPSTIVAALQGQQVLIITLSTRVSDDTQHQLVKAAAAAAVPYVVTNNWGFDPTHPSADDIPPGPKRAEIRKYAEELGKSSWVDFVSGLWYELGLVGGVETYGLDFENRSVVFFDDGKARINMSTCEQTGRAVASVFSLKEEVDGNDNDSVSLSCFKNKTVYFSSFLVSQREIFESVLRVTGTRGGLEDQL